MSNLQVGVGRVDITPRSAVPMAGYPVIHPIDGGPRDHDGYIGRTGDFVDVADPTYARAVALTDADGTAVLVSLDVCVVTAAFTATVRRRVRDAYGIPETSVMLVATHNHSGPDFTGQWEPVDPSVTAAVVDGVVRAVAEAVGSRQPATAGVGVGHLAGLTINRRDASGPVDPDVPVVRFDGADGSCLALVYGYACHPVIVGTHNRSISGEFPGLCSAMLEAVPGGPRVALFVNGGAGNINPRAFPYPDGENVVLAGRRGRDPRIRSIPVAARFATALGGEVLRTAAVTATGPLRPGQGVGGAVRTVEAPLKPADQLDRLLRHIPHSPAVAKVWRTARSLVTEVSLLRLGPLVLLGIPGEPFVETALRLQTRTPDTLLRVAGYANDYPGYLSPPDEMAKNRYESVATPLSLDGVAQVLDAVDAMAGSV
ncbi:neutral/alkaline non-lysosomal ceramidase N-terminal domain-containing protein [Polymorphospora sp. NPDC050346]|uniref:neutral/alkaline non-lysosomal ceramidase N-terminal domain-containing protein n=1 Tax=Polymorphospora sp. NPDC050346 TaxID=3155780 RepID=UPI0033EAFECF